MQKLIVYDVAVIPADIAKPPCVHEADDVPVKLFQAERSTKQSDEVYVPLPEAKTQLELGGDTVVGWLGGTFARGTATSL
jgi:hypothetical protein